MICALLEAALENRDGIWNEEGVYNVENGQMVRCKAIIGLCSTNAA
jgi:hypothetical protein